MNSKVSPARQAQCLCAVRSFLGWCSLVEAIPHLSLDSARQLLHLPRVGSLAVPEIPDDAELPALFARASIPCGTRAMLAVFLGAGLRVAELCALDRGDLHLAADGAGLLRVRGKGGKDRLAPIHPPVVSAIATYLDTAGRGCARGSSPLFIAHDAGAEVRGGTRISTRSVRRRFSRLHRQAGITRRITVHSLRHKLATAMVEGCIDLNRIRALLGHASLVTTQRYVDHLSSRRLREAVPAHLVPSDPQA